jgi:L-lactate dehydrogenase complex protein LldG
MTDGRSVILSRISDALRVPVETLAVPRRRRATTPEGIDDMDLIDLFAERVADYRAAVHRVAATEVGSAVRMALAAHGAHRVVVPAGLPGTWVDGSGLEPLVDDPALTHAQLDEADAVLTGCAVGIAETGTIVLDGGPDQGRRAISLLPDVHICVVRETQVVATVGEALEQIDPRRPLTWISGPSATSDIELSRVEGVHGPRHLHVVVTSE